MTNAPDDSKVLTTYQKLHLGGTYAGVLVAIGLAVVSYQINNLTEQSRRQTEAINLQLRSVTAQTWQVIVQEQTGISKLFVERPELRPYFHSQKSLSPSDPNYHAVMTIAEMYLDLIDGFEDGYVYQLPDMGKDGIDRILWDKYFNKLFRNSPALCVRYAELRDTYRESIERHTKPGCEIPASNTTLNRTLREKPRKAG